MRRFDIVANCSSNYTEALDFALPSWVSNSGADNIFIYTDSDIENKWGDKVKFIKAYEPSTSWVEWAGRKPKTLLKYVQSNPESTTFFLTDLDCYCVKSWRPAVEDLGWWFKAIRANKNIPDPSDKMAVSVFFGVICAEMGEFAKRWDFNTGNVSKELIADIEKFRVSGHDQMVFDALVKRYKVDYLNENIWSSERDDYCEWKEIVEKYKFEVRVLHFKGGRWKNKQIKDEILGILPDIKEYYHDHAQRKKISARILKIISLIPSLITNKKVLDVGTGNKIITTCMKVYADVTGIDIDEDLYVWDDGNEYDVVCCFDVLEHVPDVPKALEKLKKFCKKGGLIIVNQPECQHPLQPIDNLVPIESLFGLGKLVYLEHYSFAHLKEAYNFMVFVKE